MNYHYSERDEKAFENCLKDLGVENGKINTPNVSIQRFPELFNNRYNIKIYNAHYECSGYEIINLIIPSPTVLTTLGKVWNAIAVTVDVATMLLDEDPFLSPVSTECNTCEIRIVRLLDKHCARIIDIISAEDKEKLTLAMKRSKGQCDQLHGDGTLGMQLLNDFYSNNPTITVSIDNLHTVTNQFIEQKAEKEAFRKQEAERLKAEDKAKQKADREAKELRYQAYITELNLKKIKKETEIKNDFQKTGLLCQTALSNSEKLKEYYALRKFCIKYIPALSERDFNIELLHKKYPTHISEEDCRAFRDNWIRISRAYSVLNRGAIGEEKVNDVLQLYDDRIRILRSCTLEKNEHDFIVISPYGISTIEVKNLRGEYVLTETGILKCLSSTKVKPKDVAFQSKRHLETLRRMLKGCSAFESDIPLQEIICSAEPNFTIKDDYHYIPVCYYNTVDKALFPESAKAVLSKKAMDILERYLFENQREAFKFDVFLPRGEIDSQSEFIRSFSAVASGYLVAQCEDL